MKDDTSLAGLHRLFDLYTAAMANAYRPDIERGIAALDEIISRCASARELLLKMKDEPRPETKDGISRAYPKEMADANEWVKEQERASIERERKDR